MQQIQHKCREAYPWLARLSCQCTLPLTRFLQVFWSTRGPSLLVGAAHALPGLLNLLLDLLLIDLPAVPVRLLEGVLLGHIQALLHRRPGQDLLEPSCATDPGAHESSG